MEKTEEMHRRVDCLNFRIIRFFCLLVITSLALSCGGHKTKPQPPVVEPAPPPHQQTEENRQSLPDSPPFSAGVDEFQADITDVPSKDAGKDLLPTVSMPVEESSTGPSIRVGLYTATKEVRISSPETFYIQERAESVLRQTRGDIHIRVTQVKQGAKTASGDAKIRSIDGSKPIYQIQAASLSSSEGAAKVRAELAAKLEVPVFVRLNPDTGMNQIRIGEFSTREAAQNYLQTALREYPDAFVVSGETTSGAEAGKPGASAGLDHVRNILTSESGKNIVTLSGADGLNLDDFDGFRIYPASGGTSFMNVNGKTYRGSFDVFLNKSGSLTLVNQLTLENYLFGVVPAEMSPKTYPEPAALAAQAIAARTYAVKNMGRYRSDGFDLTDDTRTQVYGGVAVEDAMTNDIVLQTAGIVIYHDGKPIDAMYMSTCGGRTEDFGLVYGSAPVPYLQSVFCTVEHEHENEGVTLTGTNDIAETFRAADGSLANRNIELARVVGLIPMVASVTADSLSTPLGADEARRLIDTAAGIIKSSRRVPVSSTGIASRGGFLRQAADVFFGADEIQRRISSADENYYMATLADGSRVPDVLRPTIAWLMQRRLWRPASENTVDFLTPIRRGDAVALLVDWIEAERQDIIRRGDFMGTVQNKNGALVILDIRSGGSRREFRLAGTPRLFRVDPGQLTPIREMRLIGAEKLAFHINDKNEIDFLEIDLSPSGAASDRLSYAATWSTTLTRASIAEKLRELAGNIGNFMDMQPSHLGYSGRAVQIQAVGSRATTTMNGYRVRNALGLRDTLFTITREFDADGTVEAFTFSGRGFGHGIGMCQTGAYGLAKAGKNYTEILKTYYTGVDIKKAY